MIYWHVKKYDELVGQKRKADAFLADEEVQSYRNSNMSFISFFQKRRHDSALIMQQETNHV